MRNLIRAVCVAAVAVASAAAGCVASSASVHPAAAHRPVAQHAKAHRPASHRGAAHAARAGRLHLLLGRDAPDAVPGSGNHPLSVVTLYAGASDPQWATVESSAPTVAGAIVNICVNVTVNGQPVNEGPGCDNTDWPSQNTAWDPTVSALRAAGITPLIYITTDNGADSIATLETELAQAKQWWGITTPMFDQMVGTEGTADDNSGICTDGGADITCQSYYEQLYNYAMSNGAQAVMLNPGTWFGITPAFMYGPDEILQGFEGSAATLQGNADPAPSWAGSYAQFQFSATISGAAQPGLTADISDAASDQHAGLVYEDSETGTPNYATLGSWFSAFLTGLGSASLSDPTAQAPVQASRSSGYCLDDTNGSASNGNPVQIWKCLGNANQQWEYVPSLNGVSGDYELMNSNGKCLDDPSDATKNGTKVQIWACLGNPNQEWAARAVSGGFVEYVNANGLCLDNTSNAKKDGNRVQVWACNGGAAQQWHGPTP